MSDGAVSNDGYMILSVLLFGIKNLRTITLPDDEILFGYLFICLRVGSHCLICVFCTPLDS